MPAASRGSNSCDDKPVSATMVMIAGVSIAALLTAGEAQGEDDQSCGAEEVRKALDCL